MKHNELISLHRNSSSSRSRSSILPSTYTRSSSTRAAFSPEPDRQISINQRLVKRDSSSSSFITSFTFPNLAKTRNGIFSLLRSLFNLIPPFPNIIIPTRHLSIMPSLGRKVTGTLFGNRKGHVSFAVQDDPRSEPVLVIELATSTSALVKEMASGLVRIALECEKSKPSTATARGGGRPGKLFQEPVWTMYCNGRKSGYAMSRTCGESDWHVLSSVKSVSVGAGVIPLVDDGLKNSASEGELLYMRAKFERVVGSRDSEAFYMMNPDGNGGPELSIFLLRL